MELNRHLETSRMRVKLFQIVATVLWVFCLLGGFSLGGRMADMILQSGVIAVGPQGGWPALMLVLGMGAAGAALAALIAHRLVPEIGPMILSKDDWQRHAASLAATSMLYAVLLTVFTLPFMGAGIVTGFVAGMSLAQQGVFGLEPGGWPVIVVSLGLAMVGIHLGALVGYALILMVGMALFGRECVIEAFQALPKQTSADAGLMSRTLAKPFNAISNRILGMNF